MNIRSTITHLLSLAMVAAMATTSGFSQDTPPPAASTTLPAKRTLTATDGRKIDVTITEKSNTAIKGMTANGKAFDLPLAKLSAEDQAFIAGLAAAPVKKPTVLLVEDKQRPVLDLLEKAGFAVTNLPFEDIKEMTVTDKQQPIEVKDSLSIISKMTDDEIKKFDVIWINGVIQRVKSTTKDRIIDLIPTCKVVVWKRDWSIPRDKFIELKSKGEHELARTQPYVKSDKNLIFYYDWSGQHNSAEKQEFPEFREKAIEEAKKLMAIYHH